MTLQVRQKIPALLLLLTIAAVGVTPFLVLSFSKPVVTKASDLKIEKFAALAEEPQPTEVVETFPIPEGVPLAPMSPEPNFTPETESKVEDAIEMRRFLAEENERKQNHQEKQLHTIISGSISLFSLIASIYVILSNKYPESASKWAYGTIGIIIGFWLK